METRKISAKELSADIRSGMELSDLMTKYRIPSDRLKPLLAKLLQLGAVKPEDIKRLAPRKKSEQAPPATAPQEPAGPSAAQSPPKAPPSPWQTDTVLEPAGPAPQVPPPLPGEYSQTVPTIPQVPSAVVGAPGPEAPPIAPLSGDIERPQPPESAPPPSETQMREKKKRRHVAEIVACLAWCAVATSLLFYYPTLLAPLDLKIYDMKLALSPQPTPHPDVIHLDVDDTAIMQYGQWPWDRSMSGKIVQRLNEFGAKAVLLDVLYCAAGKSEEGNQAFFEAIKKAGNVICATGLGITSDQREKLAVEADSNRADALHEKAWTIQAGPSFSPPKVNNLKNSFVPMTPIILLSAGLGHVAASPDSDGVHRRCPLLVKLEDRYIPSLALAGLRTCWKLDPSAVTTIAGGSLEVRRGGQPIHVPLDSAGNMTVRWGDPWETFPSYSVADLLSEKPDPTRKSRYQNKVVVIGFAATGNTDLGITPRSVNVPMSRIHSFALNTILTNGFIYPLPAFPWVVAVSVVVAILFALAAPRLRWRIGLIVAFVICASAVGAVLACFMFLSWEIPSAEFAAIFLPVAGFVLVKRALTIERRAAKAARAMERYLDPKLIHEIVESGEKLDIAAKRKELTTMFVNIEGFSTIAETMDVDQLHRFLNDFFGRMTRVIFEHRGTVDKFLGDGLLAFFGEPVPLENHADTAVKAAMDMQREMARLNEQWTASGIRELVAGVEMRIGINTGTVVVGDLGSDRRVEYTVVGSAVNVAHRLQSLAPAGGVMMSMRTRHLLTTDVECEGPERIRLKGFDRDIDAYRIYPDAID